MPNPKKKVVKKVKKHRHRWENNGDFCGNCGFYEEYCRGCDDWRLQSPHSYRLPTKPLKAKGKKK